MQYRKLSLNAYVKELSSSKSVPGGGSAASLVATLGISLSLMVARITIKKVGRIEQKKLKHSIHTLMRLQKQTRILIDKDSKMYQKVVESYKLPTAYQRRTLQLQRALVASYNGMKKLCIDLCAVHKINLDIFAIARGAILNDLCVSEAFIKAALSSAVAIASLNAEFITNKRLRKKLLDEIEKIDNKKKKRPSL